MNYKGTIGCSNSPYILPEFHCTFHRCNIRQVAWIVPVEKAPNTITLLQVRCVKPSRFPKQFVEGAGFLPIVASQCCILPTSSLTLGNPSQSELIQDHSHLVKGWTGKSDLAMLSPELRET